MKNILVILVGGTICTALNENGTLSVYEKAGVLLKSNFENSNSIYKDKVNIELTENMFILSENMTIQKWNDIIDVYRKYTKEKHYDGIIFAHGTDTLAYSAALFSLLLSKVKIPIFFVSSQKRLDAPGANGNENFKCAIECICQGITPNVYVTYKNPSDERMYLHLASRLEQCKNYSDDFFSHGMIDITSITDENAKEYFKKLENKYPTKNAKSFINIYDNWHLKECVLMLSPYVGINYDAYDYKRFSAVLHTTFHSGTACAQKGISNSVLHMIDICSHLTPVVDTYFSPSRLSGEIYETAHEIGASNIKFLYGYTLETAYAKLVIAYSLFENKEDRLKFITTECNFEVIDNP